MVRILQPAGFSRRPLVQIGLIEGVKEVILLCSPESMTDQEFVRLSNIARNLGSEAVYKRETIPVIGEAGSVQKILENLTSFKMSLPKMETFISTTGSTLKFGNCLLYLFPECETLTMNRKDSTYWNSSGITGKMTQIEEDIRWRLLSLTHEVKNGKHHIYDGEHLIAEPSKVSWKGETLSLEWENMEKLDASLNGKNIARQMGLLCRINSDDRYEFTVVQPRFFWFDRYPIGTKRPVQANEFFKPVSNEFFSTLAMPEFPYGKAKSDATCLHIIVNTKDITPTAESINLHKPDHVVLWFLNSEQNDQERLENEGKVAFLISYLTGGLIENLKTIPGMKSNDFLKANPPPNLKTQFHLIEFKNLSGTLHLPPSLPKTKDVLVELNSGFLGLQHKMLNHLTKSGIQFQRWYTDINSYSSTQIIEQENRKNNNERNGSTLLLRKRIPTAGTVISTDKEYLEKLGVALPLLLSSKSRNLSHRTTKGQQDNLFRLREGVNGDPQGNFVKVKAFPDKSPYVFKINLGIANEEEKEFVEFGKKNSKKGGDDSSFFGLWLEQLAAHVIHYYWNSYFTVIGLNSQPLTGVAELLGTNDDIDIYSVSDYGVVIGEAKALIDPSPAELRPVIGQLMGEVAVFGSRKGQIPMIVLACESEKYDNLAKENNIVICSWWELQYPERILHRLATGKRTQEEIDEKRLEARKLAEEEEERRGLFHGEIELDQIVLTGGSESSCSILNVEELENIVIGISKTKFNLIFSKEKNRKEWAGYRIRVIGKDSSEIPNDFEFDGNVSAFLLNCKAIFNR